MNQYTGYHRPAGAERSYAWGFVAGDQDFVIKLAYDHELRGKIYRGRRFRRLPSLLQGGLSPSNNRCVDHMAIKFGGCSAIGKCFAVGCNNTARIA
jgi:hypothetical protein